MYMKIISDKEESPLINEIFAYVSISPAFQCLELNWLVKATKNFSNLNQSDAI